MKQEDDESSILPSQLPTAVVNVLRKHGSSPHRVMLAIPSDLGPDGEFGEQWLVIDDENLWVVNPANEETPLRYTFALDEIVDAKVERCVGNALLEVTIRGAYGMPEHPQVLLHYSSEFTNKFGHVAHYLRRRAKEGPDVPVPDPDEDANRCMICGRLLPSGSGKVCPKCMQRGKVFKRLMQEAKPYWGRLAVVVGLLLLGAGLDLTPPYLNRILIDDVLQAGSNVNLLLWLVLGLLAVRVTRTVTTITTRSLRINISARFTAGLREKLFEHVSNLPIDYFDKNHTGRLMTRINTDTRELQGLFQELTVFALNMMKVLGIGVILFGMAPKLGLYVLIPTPFVMLAAYFYHRYMRPYFERVWIARWRLNSMLNTFLSGVRVVRAFGQEVREQERYTDRNQTLLNNRLQVDLAWGRFFPLISFAFSAGGLIIWYAGGKAVLANDITLGTLMAFVGYLGMFYGPLSALTQISQTMNRFLTISQRMFEMLDEEPQPKPIHPIYTQTVEGQISLDHVTFGYDPYYPVIKDLSFTIQPGELVGIVGHSGAGKTTLINLICRFYDVDEGAIRIDGVDIRDLSMEEVRQQVGLVLQQPYLFHGTLMQNIAYGRPDATHEEIIAAAKAANAHDFITMLPEGYNTIVGEGGSGISGGERQRISIARAILNNPKVLILDEATSSVDTKTERKIQSALDKLVQGRTTIAIAHRLSTLYNADRIMVLKHGRLAEHGTPQQLMDNQGIFHELVQMQSEFASLEGAVPL
ncbi:MAG: ABC transporter ATP-binding protein [Chloroflexota bacterium]|nr:ABC transporter ATP-binding protein [Chloroflexota bacterium]